MKFTTNIYLLLDTSFNTQHHQTKLQETVRKMKRSLDFCNHKTHLHIIGYNDRAKVLSPFAKWSCGGNPNLAEGLNLLNNILLLNKKNKQPTTQSIFLLYSGKSVLQGWQKEMQKLFKNKEFAFGQRYVITCGNTDRYAQKAFEHFVDSPSRILPYFSPTRLQRLVTNVQREMIRKANN